MENLDTAAMNRWAASVYHVEVAMNCTLERAWKTMLDYETWNPSFVDAQVTPIRGKPRTEGEVVMIRKSVSHVPREALPEFYADAADTPFYAETLKVLPYRRFVWYLYPKEGDDFRNFVDFELFEVSPEVKFKIHYCAQDRISGEALIKHRKETEVALQHLAAAFKRHCEAIS